MSDTALPYGDQIPEHAPRPENQDELGTEDYQPTQDEKKAIKLALKIFSDNKKARAPHDQKWLDYYHMFRGKQWKNKRPSYRHSEVINFVWRTVQSLVPIQTDFRPRPEFLPEDPSDLPFSEVLNQVSQSDWEKNNWSEVLLDVLYDGNIVGTGLSESPYDMKADFKRGKIAYRSLDPLYCYPDPEAESMERRCETFVIAEPRPVNKVRRKYKKVAKFIKADVADIVRGEKREIKDMKFRSPVDNKTLFEGPMVPADETVDNMVLVVTVYIRPEFFDDDPGALYDERVAITNPETGDPMIDPDTGEEMFEFEQRKKWPNGRKIVIANGVLCEDEANGYDDGDIPVERYVNYLDPRQFWGISEVEQIEGPQKIFNKVFSFALDVATLTGNPIWLNPINSGVHDTQLVNRPGLVVPHNPNAAPQRVEGGQVQPWVFKLADSVERYVDTLAGSNDITQGIRPQGVVAAKAIESLQDASHTRIRQKSRNLDRYLQKFGQHWLSRVLQFYTVPRIVRLTNDQNVTKYFRMQIDKLDDGRSVATVQPYTDAGLIDPDSIQKYEISGKFDVRINTGSALPFARAEKEEKLLRFYNAGLIDEEEVLKQSDFPNYEAVLQRIRERQQREAELAAQSAAQVPAA